MKILVEIHHGLGDVVQMIPVFQKLREKYKHAEIVALVASSEHGKILEMTGLINEFDVLNIHEMNSNKCIKLIYGMRKKKFDIGMIAPMTSRRLGKLMLFLIGCKICLYPIYNDEFYNSNSVMKGLAILKPLGIEPKMLNPYLPVTEEMKGLADLHLQDSNDNVLICICVGTGLVTRGRGRRKETVNAKCIDPKISIDVANRLVEDGKHVIFLGGIEEEKKFDRYKDHIDSRVISFLGKTNIEESIAIISASSLIIGGDTGLIHIAGAMGKKTITYYAATGPMVGPFSDNNHIISANLKCQYCYGSDMVFKCEHRKCLEYITCDILLYKIKELI